MIELFLVINVRVVLPIERSIISMHKVKTGVQNMYIKCTCTSQRISVMKERLFHLLFAVVFRWSSYLATAEA